MAWHDRAAPRDLFDLWQLALAGAINTPAARLFTRYGPTNKPPTAALFTQAPEETRWRQELAGQTRLEVTATEALEVVRNAWSTVGSV